MTNNIPVGHNYQFKYCAFNELNEHNLKVDEQSCINWQT